MEKPRIESLEKYNKGLIVSKLMEEKKEEELFSDAAKRDLRPEISGPI